MKSVFLSRVFLLGSVPMVWAQSSTWGQSGTACNRSVRNQESNRIGAIGRDVRLVFRHQAHEEPEWQEIQEQEAARVEIRPQRVELGYDSVNTQR